MPGIVPLGQGVSERLGMAAISIPRTIPEMIGALPTEAVLTALLLYTLAPVTNLTVAPLRAHKMSQTYLGRL